MASRRVTSIVVIVVGFIIGLVLASMNHILPPQSETGPYAWAIVLVDWIAPPVAGTLLAGALLSAQRARELQLAEQAAAAVLADRLAGTERRQAIWVVAAAIAHDLKNPLHNLQLLVEELDEARDESERAALLQRVRENVSRATERLSELSRAGQASSDLLDASVDLSAILAELRERLRSTAQANGAAVEVSCPRGLAVRSNAHALRAAIENVAANAIEAIGENSGGVLRIQAERRNGLVELSVVDDGPGIPEALQQRLFQPFLSGKSSTGLGLAIARALARAGGGDLTCLDSRPGRTTFRFIFQAAPGVN
jgi:signal transduction histidine kinase